MSCSHAAASSRSASAPRTGARLRARAARLDSRGGTSTGMACRRRLVQRQAPSSGSDTGLSEPDLAPPGVLRGSGGTTEIVREFLGRGLGLQSDQAVYVTCAA